MPFDPIAAALDPRVRAAVLAGPLHPKGVVWLVVGDRNATDADILTSMKQAVAPLGFKVIPVRTVQEALTYWGIQ